MTYPSQAPEYARAKYWKNREKILAQRRARYAKDPKRYNERERKYRDNDEFRAVRRIKRKLWPSQNPEYRRARRALGFNA